MIDKEELRRLAVVATGLRNCKKAWRNPVSTVDCDLYYRDNSLALAEFYAAANPTTVIELLDEIERLRRHIDALHGKGDVRHRYNGLCPDETQPDSRDDECPACLLLAPNAELSGRPLADGPA